MKIYPTKIVICTLLLSGCASGVQKMECDYANERRDQPYLIESLPDGGVLIKEPPPKQIPLKPWKRWLAMDFHP